MPKRQKQNQRTRNPPGKVKPVGPTGSPGRSVGVFNLFLAAFGLVLIWMLARHGIEMGTKAGGWAFPYKVWVGAPALVTAAILIPAAAGLTYFSAKFIETREALIVLAWIVFGYCAHVALIRLEPLSFTQVILSDTANSFYKAAAKYRPLHLLGDYDKIAPTLGRHAFTNMPGKILFYHAMMVFTSSPEKMGYIILGVSDLGALSAYAAAKRLYRSRVIGLYAMILFVLIPARIYFIPLLNTVTPGLILVPLWMLVCYLDKPRPWLALLLGAAFFGLFVFEPLSYFCGLSFAAVIAARWNRKDVGLVGIAKLLGLAAAGFLIAYGVLFKTTQFNAIHAFIHQFHYAKQFLVDYKRPYAIWLIHGPKEFFLNAGIAQSVIFAVMLWAIGRQLFTRSGSGRRVRDILLDGDSAFTLSFAAGVAILFITEIHGGGENTRLLLFFTPFLQMIAASACVQRFNPTTFLIALATTILQTAVTISTVSFLPWSK